MHKPNPRGCCGNPGICLIKCAQRQKSAKGLPRATHCTDRAQTSGNVSPTVELCPPHPTFRTKVRARRNVSEGEKKIAIKHIHINILLRRTMRLHVFLGSSGGAAMLNRDVRARRQAPPRGTLRRSLGLRRGDCDGRRLHSTTKEGGDWPSTGREETD